MALVVAFPAHGQDTSTKPLKVVEIDTGSAAVEGHLPFDEPFLIRGVAAANLLRVAMQIAPLPDDWSRASSHRDTTWTRFDSSAARFSLLVPALDPGKTYRFEFEFLYSLPDSVVAAFVEDAAARIDRALRPLALGEGMPPTEYADLLRLIRSAIVLPPNAYLVQKGILFEPENATLPIPEILSLQDERLYRVADVESTTAALQQSLNQLLASPLLDELADKPGSGLSAETAKLIAETRGVLESDVRPIADGRMVLGAPFNEIATYEGLDFWDPAVAMTRMNTYRSTATTLHRLATDMTRLRARSAKLQSVHVTHAAVSDFLARLQGARILVSDLLSQHDQLQDILGRRSERISAIARELVIRVRRESTYAGRFGGDFKTRSRWHVSQDLGLVYVDDFDDVLPFFGLNFYLRPINRDAPLSWHKDGLSLRKRFSVTVGITRNVSKSQERDNLLAGGGLLIAGGLRISEIARLSLGRVLFKRDDPHPLVTRFEIASEWAAAVSMDIEIKEILGKLGTSLSD